MYVYCNLPTLSILIRRCVQPRLKTRGRDVCEKQFSRECGSNGNLRLAACSHEFSQSEERNKIIPAGDAECIFAKDGARLVAAVTGRGFDRYDCMYEEIEGTRAIEIVPIYCVADHTRTGIWRDLNKQTMMGERFAADIKSA